MKKDELNNRNFADTKAVLYQGFDYVMPFGKYKGKTLIQILDENPSYIIWLSENDVVEIPDDLLTMACHDTMSPDFEDLCDNWEFRD